MGVGDADGGGVKKREKNAAVFEILYNSDQSGNRHLH